MSYTETNYSESDLQKILETIKKNNYQKIVIQLDKQSTQIAMDFTNTLKKNQLEDPKFINSEIIILSDSLKNTCCEDNILADRISGEFLIKIGSSCNTNSFGQCKIREQFHLELKKSFNVEEISQFLVSEVFGDSDMNFYFLLEDGYQHLQENLREKLISDKIDAEKFSFLVEKSDSQA